MTRLMGDYDPSVPAIGRRRHAEVSDKWIELTLYVFLITDFLNGLLNILTGGADTDLTTATEGNSLSQAIYALLFLATIYVLRSRVPITSLMPLSIFFVVGWCCASLAWAADPSISIRRIALMSIAASMIFGLNRPLTPQRSLQILSNVLLISLVVDLFGIALLDVAIQNDSAAVGGWKGFHNDKNAAGALVAVSCMMFIYRVIEAKIPARRFFWIAMTLLATIYLYKTQSKTSFQLIVPTLIIGTIASFSAVSSVTRYVFIASLISLLVSAYLGFDRIQNFINATLDDPTAFTGRSEIWATVLPFIPDHFWLGAGYGSFFETGEGGLFSMYGRGWVLTMPNAHDGYLDMTIQTGMVGLILSVFSVIVVPIWKIIASKPIAFGSHLWVIACVIIFAIFHNLTEVSYFDRANALWVCVMTAIACLSNANNVKQEHTAPPTPNSRGIELQMG